MEESTHHDHGRLQVHRLPNKCEVYKWKWTVVNVPVGGGVLVCHVNTVTTTTTKLSATNCQVPLKPHSPTQLPNEKIRLNSSCKWRTETALNVCGRLFPSLKKRISDAKLSVVGHIDPPIMQ